MVETTPNISLRVPLQTELPHPFNSRTVHRLEASTVTRLESLTDSSPPSAPGIGDCYFVAQGAVGTAWEGLTNAIAHWTGGAWESWQPGNGSVAWIVPERTNKTYISGEWIEFNESTVLTSKFLIEKPGTFSLSGPVTYTRFDTVASTTFSGESGLYVISDRPSTQTAVTTVGGNICNSTIAAQTSQLYPLYRYVGDYGSGTYATEPRMPKLLSIEVRVDGDANVMYSSPNMSVRLAPAEGPTRSLTTFDDRVSATGSPVQHRLDEYISEAEDVLNLQRINQVPNSGTYTHITSSNTPITLEPGYLFLCLNSTSTQFGEGVNYASATTLGEVTVSMTVSSDF